MGTRGVRSTRQIRPPKKLESFSDLSFAGRRMSGMEMRLDVPIALSGEQSPWGAVMFSRGGSSSLKPLNLKICFEIRNIPPELPKE